MSAKLVSIVLPVYNEARILDALYRRLDKVSRSLTQYQFEFIFVNDGSSDQSLEKLVTLARSDRRLVVINLSRNFGHQLAITAGLDHASGDAVITMDSDLQDPPEVCRELIKQWASGYHIVYARRASRRGESIFKRASARVFYALAHRLSDTPIPENVGDFRLMDRQVVTELIKFREHSRFLRGLVSFVGFSHTTIEFDRAARKHGRTAYSLPRMLRLAFDGITGFSTAPLKFISRLGYAVSLASLVAIGYTLWVKLFEPNLAVPGWAFITVSIFFIGGIQMIMLGILGSYIARIYTEAQDRPLYIVASIVKRRTKKSRP